MSLQRQRRRLAGSAHQDEIFSNQDLRNAIADGASFQNCTFRKCLMGQASFRGAYFSGCHFEDCDLRQAILICRLADCTFVGCDFDQAVFSAAIVERTYFEKCRFEYAVFSRATIVGGGFVDCQLHGAYFDLAESAGVDFSESNFWGIVMPMSCAMIPGNKFDHRQLHMFLSLVMHADLDYDDRVLLEGIVDKKVFALVERIIARTVDPETNEEVPAKPEADDDRAS